MKVTLSLTHRCNLACRYCYSGKTSAKDMSLTTAQTAVDFALGVAPPGSKIDFSFFGGEPLLCFDLMKSITAYLNERGAETGFPCRLSTTTNGTLLSRPILDFFRDERVDLCVSIDGPAHVHNLNRCYRDGRGSLENVLRQTRRAVEHLGYVQVNAVFDDTTLDSLPETVAFLDDLGAAAIHLNPNISATWPLETRARLRDAYMRVAEYYIQCYRRGRELALNLIDTKAILFLKKGYAAEDKCGMGETEWGIAPSGNVYPCERFVGEDLDSSLCLGNVHTGLDVTRRCAVLQRRGNRNEECKTCAVQEYCMNWCGCTNHFMTGHTDLAAAALCASERAAIDAARHVFTTLSALDNKLFIEHLLQYVHDGRQCV